MQKQINKINELIARLESLQDYNPYADAQYLKGLEHGLTLHAFPEDIDLKLNEIENKYFKREEK